ncbi:cupin domain-containing protein [Patescibacteria group bacterium]|nr:cupin domain-containing protein [Patescibacteria group bacterium]
MAKKGYKENIEKLTQDNKNFRKVLYTAKHCQLVLMALAPSVEIGIEVHEENDQFFRFEKGQGKVIINETEYEVGDGDAVIVPSGAKHNVINTSQTESLQLYTLYTPPHHKDGIVRETKEQAEKQDAEFEGELSE